MTDPRSLDLAQFIRSIPDFPKPGILFRDITPLLESPEALRAAIVQLADKVKDRSIDVIAAAEARGFLFAAPLALELGVGLIPIRKPGKLPFETIAYSYELEYGTDTLEMHVDAVKPGMNVLVVDDLLATGGTVEACCKLIEKAGGNVTGCAFVIDLVDLKGSERLAKYRPVSLLQFEGE
ncbi:MAG: adenine phosphoribosyltransferase [Planctomycetota bacterium]|nr:MAG: adenine phosphoribosyltransferase [Planctomycetota bacterium]